MKVIIVYEVSDETAYVVSQYSLERVINESKRLISMSMTDEGDADLNIEDWEVCKPIAVQLWNALRDGVFRVKTNDMKQIRDWSV